MQKNAPVMLNMHERRGLECYMWQTRLREGHFIPRRRSFWNIKRPGCDQVHEGACEYTFGVVNL